MEMYLYLYLRLINYKLGNKGRRREEKTLKLGEICIFAKHGNVKSFVVFSCPSMMIAVETTLER